MEEYLSKKYDWKPEITPVGNTFEYVFLNTFNGEGEYIDFTKEGAREAMERGRAIPKMIGIGWEYSTLGSYNQRVFFDEEEIFKAFEKFQKINPNGKLLIELEISGVSESVRVLLKDKRYFLELKKTSFSPRYH